MYKIKTKDGRLFLSKFFSVDKGFVELVNAEIYNYLTNDFEFVGHLFINKDDVSVIAYEREEKPKDSNK